MPPTREISTQANTDLPTFRIFANGTELPTTIGVGSIIVNKSINRISTAKLIIEDGDMATEEFELSSGEDFIPGSEIEIHAGYHGIESQIFKGIVIKHGINFKSSKTSELVLELKDVCVKASVGKKNRYFEESTDSDIIEEILGEYSDLELDIEATDLEHKEMVQYYCTDWDFVLSRADINGKYVFVDDGSISVKAPDFSADPLFILAQGDNVIEFEAEMDARTQVSSIAGKSWDYAGQEVVESEGADPGVTEIGNLSASDLSDVIGLESFSMQHSGQVVAEELQAWTDAKLLKSMMSKVRGRVKIIGFSDIKPGDLIELESFGDRFNGTAYVSGISHIITASAGWYTNILFGLSDQWFADEYDNINDKPASGLLPPINGLHFGIVTNIHEDPDGEARVKVKVPIISTEDEGVWARIATLDAGNNRGTFFRPEVDDEVVVGFINDDPRDPVILGMLHSSALASPIEPTEDNFEKGIITKEELKFLFDDDKKSILFETPNGNKITLSDDEGSIKLEDENGNIFEMNSDGISIESDGDITLKAGGDVKIEGTNIENTSNADFKVSASAGADITASANAVLKGAMVQIN
ncbi:MAG: type VI secretion system tip protein VgrG [Bacteroidales bacterium]|nr:type VI secretion system tip protein VgrG [Bacteroidales bacterium]